MGLKGIPSPKTLWQWSGLTFCLWCRKEGQNEGTMVNHLQTTNYHQGLISTHCLDYCTTSADAMHWHAQLGDDDDREEEDYEDDDNGDEDDEFMFKED